MKKRINIVLILAVLGLWGTVVYKAVSQYLFPKEFVENVTPSKDIFNSNQISKDTFLLEVIPRDPFLNKQNQTKPSVSKVFHSKTINSSIAPITKPIENKNWPIISYYGYIKSKDKNEELILVKINQKIYKLRKNDLVEGITIKQVYNDSIALYFNKERKIIKLNK